MWGRNASWGVVISASPNASYTFSKQEMYNYNYIPDKNIQRGFRMTNIEITTFINATPEKCFDAARNIDLHTETVWTHTNEQAIHGVVHGYIGLGETVTFKATHFGIRQTLTSRIIEFQRPYLF